MTAEMGALTVRAVPACVRVATNRSTDDLTPEQAIEMGNVLIQAGDASVMHPDSTVSVKFSNWSTEVTAAQALLLGRTLVDAGEALR